MVHTAHGKNSTDETTAPWHVLGRLFQSGRTQRAEIAPATDSKEEPDRGNYRSQYVDGLWASWWKYVAATASTASTAATAATAATATTAVRCLISRKTQTHFSKNNVRKWLLHNVSSRLQTLTAPLQKACKDSQTHCTQSVSLKSGFNKGNTVVEGTTSQSSIAGVFVIYCWERQPATVSQWIRSNSSSHKNLKDFAVASAQSLFSSHLDPDPDWEYWSSEASHLPRRQHSKRLFKLT